MLPPLDSELAWYVVKLARINQLQPLLNLGEPIETSNYFATSTIKKAISETDRNTITTSLEWMCNQIGEKTHFNDLIQHEID